MIRALWSVIVVCLVAVSGGDGFASRVPAAAATVSCVAPGQIREALRPAQRASVAGARTPLPEQRTSDAVLAAAPRLPVTARRVLPAPSPGRRGLDLCPILTGSARGPPIV